LIWVAGVDAREDAKSRVIITFRDAPTGSDIRKVSDAGGNVTRLFKIVPSLAAELPASAIEGLRADPRVLLVEPDRRVQLLDAELDSSWGVKRIGSGLVHPTNEGAGVKVAVIDTGIDYNHTELDGNYVSGYDFVNNDGNPMDDQGHGTMVSGVIAAEDNGSGVVGVAPQARLYGVKVLDASGSGWESDVIAGVDWARTNGMQVVNMSLGSSSASYSFQTAIANAQNAGLVLVAAAGNAGNCYATGDNVTYPGRFSQVIAVAATDSNDLRACFSSTGSAVDIAAPGVSTLTTYRGGGYRSASGTSLASPHVAGTAALVIASGVSSNTAVRDRLLTTADDLGANGRDSLYGYGLVDADEAAGGSSPPPSTHDVAVTSVSAPGSVTQGSTVGVGVTVANQGTVSETFTVTLRDGASTIGSSSRSLAAGGSTTVNFSWNTTGVATGAHTLTATAGPVSGETDTADNSRTASVTVSPPPPPSTHDVAVTSVSAPGSVSQGSTVGVGVTVANQGTVSETFAVILRDGASTIGSSSRSLAAGAASTVNFSWNTSGVATGAHTLTATAGPVSGETDTADNSRTASVTVNGASGGGLSLEVTMAGHPMPGQYVFVDVKVTNSGILVSGATVDVLLDTQGADQTIRKTTDAGGYASFRFLTKYNAALPWIIRATASSGGLGGTKTCTYNGGSLLC
jgi:subtilisin family serine protease